MKKYGVVVGVLIVAGLILGFTGIGQADMPKNGLVAEYLFDGDANDTSGNGNHGTVNGAILTSDRNGNTNSAYSCDGLDDYIKTNHPDLDSQSLSISVWFRLAGHNPYTADACFF